MHTPSEEGVVASIDIKVNTFFWLLRPWKEGKLVTIDGRGRFAEISFSGEDKISIKPLVDFPRTRLDSWGFYTWPEAGLVSSSSADGIVKLLAAIDDGKTKSHIPMFTRTDMPLAPVLLDPNEGLIAYGYAYGLLNTYSVTTSLYVYNYKTDIMVYNIPLSRDQKKGFSIGMNIAINDQYVLGYKRMIGNGSRKYDRFFYNWKTGEITRNELTDTLYNRKISVYTAPGVNINLDRRYLFGEIKQGQKWQSVKVDWEEHFSDVRITYLSSLYPRGKYMDAKVLLSADGSWGTVQIGGYRGLDDESLYRRIFFHLDEKYPNGISRAVFADDFEELDMGYCAFVQHPVYGLCLAQAVHDLYGRRNQRFLRLYKMDDVLAEIESTRENEGAGGSVAVPFQGNEPPRPKGPEGRGVMLE